ncbi:hypothetical protein ACFL03_06665 [Thermodesulfobacteriota bacterium]
MLFYRKFNASCFMRRATDIIFLIASIGILYGCAALSVIPVTLKEVKNHIVGQQKSFAHPLDKVMVTSAIKLREMEFVLLRIENFNQKGFIHAKWQDVDTELYLETVTPKLTKMKSKIRGKNKSREYSTEEAFFQSVHNALNQNETRNLNEFTDGMINVHISPDNNSPVIAYLGTGEDVEFVEQVGTWARIGLMDSYAGFAESKYFHDKPKPTRE